MIIPLAPVFQCGAPSPVNAGTKNTPPLSGILSAITLVLAAWSTKLILSRNHWITWPAIKILAPIEYFTFPSLPHATVRSPFSVSGATSPVYISGTALVPYVFFAAPSSKQACPNNAALWSPAIPVIGISAPNHSGSVYPKIPTDGLISGSIHFGIFSIERSSSSHFNSWAFITIERAALE